MPLADARGRLERPDTYKDLRGEFVVVSVAGMPMMGMGGGRMGAPKGEGKKGEPLTPEEMKERQNQMQERVKDATSMAIGKNVYRPEDIRMSRTASGSVMLFAFSRKEIEVGDEKTLQFKTIMGPMELNVKFNLKDMVYQGKVSL